MTAVTWRARRGTPVTARGRGSVRRTALNIRISDCARTAIINESTNGSAMPFYKDRVYPCLVSMLGNPKPIENIRQRLLPLACGDVLEIGVGPGVNFVYYDPARVTKLYALEPNPGMVKRAQRQRRGSQLAIEFLDLPGEHMPLADESVDTVVSTFTLCTIPGVVEAINGLRRVLKPDGQLIFLELGLSPDPSVRRWQKR